MDNTLIINKIEVMYRDACKEMFENREELKNNSNLGLRIAANSELIPFQINEFSVHLEFAKLFEKGAKIPFTEAIGDFLKKTGTDYGTFLEETILIKGSEKTVNNYILYCESVLEDMFSKMEQGKIELRELEDKAKKCWEKEDILRRKKRALQREIDKYTQE